MSLPNGWRTCRLGDVLTLINGRAYKREELLSEGTPVLRIQNLNDGDRWYYSNLTLPKDKYCEAGDLLFAWSASFGPYIFKGPKSIYHYHIWKIALSQQLDKGFAYYLLQDITGAVKAAGRGISMLHMTKAGMEDWQVSIPPLEEQRRIAGILDQADALRRLRTRALDKLNTLGQAIFYEMFGDDRVQLPTARLGDVCDVRDGTHDSPKYVEDGFPLLTSKNFSSGRISFEAANMISEADFEQINKRSKVDQGDIVMPMIGTIGSPVIIQDEPNFAIKNVALIKFTAKSPKASFIHALLSGPYLDKVIKQQGRGGTQKFLSLGDLRRLEFPLPSVEHQETFERHSAAIQRETQTHISVVASQERLFASLQHRAFRGEL